MKRVTSTSVLPFLAMLVAISIQGCGGSGGGGNDAGDSSAAAGGLQTPGANFNDTNSDVGIHPKSGPAGSTVAISGRGFGDVCGAALYLEKAGGDSFAETTVSGGAFNVQAVLPESIPAGDLTIVGELLEINGQECTRPTGTTFETSFGVSGQMPIITLGVLEGRPGTSVDVQGRGFCFAAGCSPVTLLIDGQVAASGVAVADDGTFSTAAIVPAIDAAGAVAVVATQTDVDDTELRGFGELIVTVRPGIEPPVVQ